MKNFFLFISLSSFVLSSNAQDTWISKNNFGGIARYGAVGFSIGARGYIGTGTDGFVRQKSFWEWNQSTNVWTQKADFGGAARYTAVGFSIGTKGYIGTGEIGGFTNDFWEWNQSTNTWTQKANFGGTVRWGAAGFSIGTKGYIGTGNDGANRQDFWEWDQGTDVWTRKTDFGGTARYSAIGFSIGTKGYIGTGNDGANKQDFWEWDQATDVWTRKTDFGGTARYAAVGFSIGTKGYIGTGNDGANKQDFWEWNQATDVWIQKINFSGTTRYFATGFSIDRKGYIGTGLDVTSKQDFWEWSPPPSKINSYEYWFDNSYAARSIISISPAESFNLVNGISTAGLTDGLHAFHIWFRDDYSSYSSVISQFFQKIPAITAANRKIVAYEYWYDNNYGSKTFQPVSAQSQIQALTGLSASALNDGLHTIHIRFKDDAGTWSSALSQFFQKLPATTTTNNKIEAYEYWYDNNYSSKIFQPVSAQNQIQVLTGLSASALNDGLHTFHIRFKDDAGVWSSALSQFFQKIPAAAITNRKILAYEYWYDNNFGSKVLQPISAQSNVQVITGLVASALNDGLHTFHIRFLDDAGVWSSVLSQFFQKIPANSPSNVKLETFQYWFDNDFSSRVTQAVTPQTSLQIVSGINVATLTAGLHVYHIRFRDENGAWSSALSQFFQKIPSGSVLPNLITAYRYWMDSLYVNVKQINLAVPVNPYDLFTTIDMKGIRKGKHTIHFQFLDTLDQWSVALTDTFEKKLLLIPSFTADNSAFCDNGTVSFTNNSVDGDTYLWNFGDGSTDTAFSPSHTYTVTGTFSVQLTITDTVTHTDSSVTFGNLITVTPTPTNSVTILGNDSICSGQSVTLSAAATGVTYQWSTGATTQSIPVSTAGNYSVTLNRNGCLSQSNTYSITVVPPPSTPTVTVSGPATFCTGGVTALTSGSASSYLWSNGATTQNISVTTPGNYSLVVANSFGCTSSTAGVNITVNSPPLTPTITAGGPTTFCAGNSLTLSSSNEISYLWSNGATTQSITVNTSGNYSVAVTNSLGCTTVSAMTNVLVNPAPATSSITASGPTTFCSGNSTTLTSNTANSYVWNNGASTQSISVNTTGNYSLIITNANGCSASSGISSILVNPLPNVTAGILTDTFCVYSFSEILIGNPAGGSWTGQGVSGNAFDPAVAGAGLWGLVYTYSDANSCSNSDTMQVYVDLCTGTHAPTNCAEIRVFPNPNNGEFRVLTGNAVAEDISIFDAVGETIIVIKPTGSTNNFDLRALASGMYLLHIRSGQAIFNMKIVKE